MAKNTYARIDRIVDGIKKTFAEINRLESVNKVVFDNFDYYTQGNIEYKNIWLDSKDLPYIKDTSKHHLWKVGDVYPVPTVEDPTATKILVEGDPEVKTVRYSVNDAIESRIRKSSIAPSAGVEFNNNGTLVTLGAGERTVVSSIYPKLSVYLEDENDPTTERPQLSIIQFYNDISLDRQTDNKHKAQQFYIKPLNDLIMTKLEGNLDDNLLGGVSLDVDLSEYVKTINAGLKKEVEGPNGAIGHKDFTIRVDKNLDDHNLIVDAFNLPYTYVSVDDESTPVLEENKSLVDKTIGDAIKALETKSIVLNEDKILTWTPNGIKADVKLVKVEGSNHVEIQGKIDTTGTALTNPHFGQPFDLGDFDIAVGIELAFNAIIIRTEPKEPSNIGQWSFINVDELNGEINDSILLNKKNDIIIALNTQFGEVVEEGDGADTTIEGSDGVTHYFNTTGIEVGHYLVFGFKDVGATQHPAPTKPGDPVGPNLENRPLSYTAINLSKLISPYYAGDSIEIVKGQDVSLVLDKRHERDLKIVESNDPDDKDIKGKIKKRLTLNFFTGTQDDFNIEMAGNVEEGKPAFDVNDPASNIANGFDGTYFIYD